MPRRLDAWLVAHGHAQSRARASDMIASGLVRLDGRIVTKPSRKVDDDTQVQVEGRDHAWVGRGALKLLAALAHLPMCVDDRVCADLGASTGGFTQVLLDRGALRVYAVDVGHDQLAATVREDPRVVVLDGTNVRTLTAFPEPVMCVVGDLSFISLVHVLPVISRLLQMGGEAIILVKPQFEVGPNAVGKGGRVRLEQDRRDAIARIQAACAHHGLHVLGGVDSEVPGAKAGNVEYFMWVERVAGGCVDTAV